MFVELCRCQELHLKIKGRLLKEHRADNLSELLRGKQNFAGFAQLDWKVPRLHHDVDHLLLLDRYPRGLCESQRHRQLHKLVICSASVFKIK